MTKPPDRLYLLYHELRPSRSDYSYVVETSQFEKHVELFLELRKRQPPGFYPEITFDDGHLSNFEFALPILQSRAITRIQWRTDVDEFTNANFRDGGVAARVAGGRR